MNVEVFAPEQPGGPPPFLAQRDLARHFGLDFGQRLDPPFDLIDPGDRRQFCVGRITVEKFDQAGQCQVYIPLCDHLFDGRQDLR